MLEEIDVIVASLLDILLRTILEITSRPQASGSATRLHFQDVTVSPQANGRGAGHVRVTAAVGRWEGGAAGIRALALGVSTKALGKHSRVRSDGPVLSRGPACPRAGQNRMQRKRLL